MPVRERVEDPKVTALRASRCLNPHPERVLDPVFLSEEFFDARDAVQVKYEMVRRVQVDGESVTAIAAAFGYSRPSYYQAAAALAESGLDGLVPVKPGPRGGHKLTGEILTWAEEQLAEDPMLRPAGLVDLIAGEFGVHVHPRSIERALARHREHSKSR
jgi:transposase